DRTRATADAAVGNLVVGNEQVLRTRPLGRESRQKQRIHRLPAKRVARDQAVRRLQQSAASTIVQELVVAHDVPRAGKIQVDQKAALVGRRDRMVQRKLIG